MGQKFSQERSKEKPLVTLEDIARRFPLLSEAIFNEVDDQRKIEKLEYSNGALERQNKSLEDELNAKQAELSGLRTTVAELTSSSAGIEAKLKSTQLQLDSARQKVAELTKLLTEQAEY